MLAPAADGLTLPCVCACYHPACMQVCALFERAINAEGSDVDVNVDQIAAAAMQAVEGAVKDEVEAAAVVSATQTALANTLKDLQALSGQSMEEEAAAAAVALASMDGSKGGAAAADAIQLLDSLTGGSGGAAAGAAGGAVLQVVQPAGSAAPGSNGTPSGSKAPSAVSPAPSPPPAAAWPPGYVDPAKAKKEQAKAKLLKAAAFGVAAALGFAFIKSTAGEVSVRWAWCGVMQQCRYCDDVA